MTTNTNTPVDYGAVLDVVQAVAREAAELIRAEFYRPGGPRGPRGHCPVDEDVEVLLRDRLRASFPRWPFYGEETGLTGEDDLHHWLVDPHDGTSAFQRGFRGTAISIALLRGTEPVLGLVLAPCPPIGSEDLIAWAEGCGPVTRNDAPVMRSWPQTLDAGVVVLVSQDADSKPKTNAGLTAPARYLCVPSVAYRMALTAVGEGDAAVSVVATSDYDFAGAHAIIRGAGGVLLDAGGREVVYASSGGRQTGSGGLLVGGSPDLAKELVQRPWQRVLSGRREKVPFVGPRPDRIAGPYVHLDRAQGLMLGQFIGDALGAQVEFQTAVQIARSHPDGVRTIEDGGPWNTIAGQPTDDSEMALALARSLVEDGRYEVQNVARADVDWYRSGPFDIGNTVRTACAAGARAGKRGLDVVQTMKAAANPDSQANGALMRIAPIALLGHRDLQKSLEWAVEDAMLTHPHPVCLAANVAFVAALCSGIRGATDAVQMVPSARDAVQNFDGAEAVIQRLDDAAMRPPARLDSSQMGWVLHALQNAFFELLHASSFEEGLVATVGRGGDTDTNGAIAGALLGAFHGAMSVPGLWPRSVLTCRALKGTRRPRGGEFWPADALHLAEELVLRHDVNLDARRAR